MRELHERLNAVGLVHEASDVFDANTTSLVEAFQRSRGLRLTGDVDETTWERLEEARWKLGQRLLYLATPHLRGDDVAELQVKLAQLGFNPGRIDGIFGPLLDEALREFQQNRGLDPHATLTRAALIELTRFSATITTGSMVNEARELAGFDPPRSAVVLGGEGPLLHEVARRYGPDQDVHVLDGASPHDLAAFANEREVALVLAFEPDDEVDGIRLHYWAGYRSHSRRGEELASLLASSLAKAPNAPRVEVTGMALDILRETRMTTVHVAHGMGIFDEIHPVITAFEGLLAEVIHSTPSSPRAKSRLVTGERTENPRNRK